MDGKPRRDARFNVSVLIGGVKGLDQWQNVFIMDFFKNKVLKPDEPIWWPVSDKTILAVFRDNAGSGRLFRSFSKDLGQTWSAPIKTNYPKATSKVFSMLTSTGERLIVGNANPKLGRRQLLLSLSKDGLVFTRMFLLDIPAKKPSSFQYPHVMEKDGKLYIAYSTNKEMIEMIVVAMADLAASGPKRQ
jgi:predicted neuraminidase